MGAGFGAALLVLGAIREVLGSGTLFANMDLLFGPLAANWSLQIFASGYSFLVAILPPGAFIITGLLIALKNALDARAKLRKDALKEKPLKGAKRVRTTGVIH